MKNNRVEEYINNFKNFRIQNSKKQELILEHLISEGYIETADVFMKETGIISDINIENCEIKNNIRKLLISYKVDEVINLLTEHNTNFFNYRADIKIELLLLKFIKIVKSNNILEAINYSKTELKNCYNLNSFYSNRVSTVVTMLAYQNLSEYPFQFFINKSYCLKISSMINSELNSSTLKESNFDKLVKLYRWAEKKSKDNSIKISNFTPFTIENK